MWFIHIIVYYTALERNSVTCYNMDEPQGHYAKQNKSLTEAQILCDSTHMKY